MTWRNGFIAVDWGTTNRRAYRVEHDASVGTFADDLGLMAVPAGGFPGAVEDIRDKLGDLPMLLAGMVGSDRGWHEAPYVECPAGPAELAAGIVWVDPRTGIVPGVCLRGPYGPDVMRGEEVQLIGGMAAGLIPPDSLVCHPGTHAKWAVMESGRIARFRTVMTGEIFALLREHSILADALAGDAKTGAEFVAGVAEALTGEPLLSALFRIRAHGLLNGRRPDAVSRASGLLIGSEIAGALREMPDTPVAVMGRADLCELYSRALDLAGRASSIIDGPACFVAGIAVLTEYLL
jgi:2-dehydro-3-deoxygalactonokinase